MSTLNLSFLRIGGAVLAMWLAAPVFAQVSDPVPGPILPSGLLLELEDYLAIPPSSPAKPYARINLLREAPDGSGRLCGSNGPAPGRLLGALGSGGNG